MFAFGPPLNFSFLAPPGLDVVTTWRFLEAFLSFCFIEETN